MLYQEYKEKMSKRLSIIQSVMRFRLLILAGLLVAIAFTVTMVSINGIVYGETCPDSVTYGTAIEPTAAAIFGDVSYEYRAQGSEEWLSGVPVEAGSYELRAVSDGSFGPTHGKIMNCEILPKQTEILITDKEIIYGDTPNFEADLGYSDRVKIKEFDFVMDDEIVLSLDKRNISVVAADGRDVTASYDFTLNAAALKVRPRPISIEVTDATKVYDGTALASDLYTVGGTLAENDELELTFSASVTDVGEVENSPAVALTNEKTGDVSAFYDIDVRVGKLTITKRPLKIFTDFDELVYDGKPHSYPLDLDAYKFEEGESNRLADGQHLTSSAAPIFKNVGSEQNAVTVEVFDGENNNVTENYDLSYAYGTINITKRPIHLVMPSDEFVYDGKEHIYTLDEDEYAYEAGSEENLAENHRFEIAYISYLFKYASKEECNIILDVDIVDEYGESVLSNYNCTEDFGTVKVNFRPIHLVIPSDEFVYDGKEHTYTIDEDKYAYEAGSEENLAENHKLKLTYKDNKFKDASEDEYNITLDVDIVDENGKSAFYNYNCTTDFGTVKIDLRPLKITTASDEFVYDGKEHIYPLDFDAYKFEEGADNRLAEGHYMTSTEPPVFKDVNTEIFSKGNINNNIWVEIFDGEDNNVTKNYNLIYNCGIVKITKRPINIVTASDEFVYDGTEHVYKLDETPYLYKEGSNENLAEGHSFEEVIYLHGSNAKGYNYFIDAGKYDNIVRIHISDGIEDVTDNYDISYEEGEISILKRPIHITTDSGDWVYDGKEHKKELDTAKYAYVEGSDKNLAKGHTIIVTSDKSIKTVGEIDNEVEIEIHDARGQKVTFNYEVTFDKWGTLTVTKRPLIITTGSEKVTYDGKYHSKKIDESSFIYAENEENKLAENQTMEVTFFTNEIDAAEEPYTNVNEVIITDGVEDVTENYDIRYDYGTIEIDYRELNINTGSKTWTYDGQPHDYLYIDGFTENETENEDYNNNRYDDLNNQLAENQYLRIVNSTSVKDADSVSNVLEVKIYDASDEDVTRNYKITYGYGTLTVNLRPVTVKSGSKTWVYDGEEHSYPKLIVENDGIDDSGIVSGHTYNVSSSTTIKDITDTKTEVRYTDNVIEKSAIRIFDKGEDVTRNYDITVTAERGKLRIKTQTKVVISAQSKEYDAQTLTFDASSAVRVLVHAPDETVTVTGTESITTVGAVTLKDLFGKWAGGSNNARLNISVTANGISVPDDEIKFMFISADNVLEVKRRKIVITSKSASKKKEDGELRDGGYDITSGALVEGDYVYNINVSGVLRNNQTTAQNTVSGAVIVDASGHDVTSNYEITYQYGTLSWIDESEQ